MRGVVLYKYPDLRLGHHYRPGQHQSVVLDQRSARTVDDRHHMA